MAALLVLFLAALFSVATTWLARRCAIAFGLIEHADHHRKMPLQPVAVVGGVALVAAILPALACAALLRDDVAEALRAVQGRAIWLFIGIIIIVAVGVLDDLQNLRARYKLMGQFAASTVLILGGGYQIQFISLFDIPIPLGNLAFPISLLWFLAIINAMNLLDGMDGMLGSVGVIVFGSLVLMAIATGHLFAVVVAAAMAGALVGFLRFNLPPATVYLGDSGSMMIGLVIAAVSIHASIKGPAFVVLVPMGLLVLPIMDTAAAILRRKLTGRGLAIPDHGHLHHMLQKQGLTVRRVLAVVLGLGLLASVGAVSSTWLQNDSIAIAMAGGIVLILIAAGLFGSVEYQLLRQRAITVLRSARGSASNVETEVRLQGHADWSAVWSYITFTAEKLKLDSVCLDVNAPIWHEGYLRRWVRSGRAMPEINGWNVRMPLFVHELIIGHLTICGHRTPQQLAIPLGDIAELILQIELLTALMVPDASLTQPSDAASPFTKSI